ncbi:MAG: ABC transporter ATP-binding protein, partial [Planctomycetota bacterium]
MTLSLRQLRFERPDFNLGPIDLDIPVGKRTVLLGPSGCGKTTLLRLIAGLETPTSGTVQYGDSVFSGSDRWTAPDKRSVAFVFQNLALWPHMKAWKQVDYAGRCGRQAACELLDRVGLNGKQDRLPGELSGGEGQRVALARALAQNPRILLLDEPLRSVDPPLREELQELFLEVSREESLTKIFVTHDREEALALGEEIILMNEGQVIECGPAETLFHQ